MPVFDALGLIRLDYRNRLQPMILFLANLRDLRTPARHRLARNQAEGYDFTCMRADDAIGGPRRPPPDSSNSVRAARSVSCMEAVARRCELRLSSILNLRPARSALAGPPSGSRTRASTCSDSTRSPVLTAVTSTTVPATPEITAWRSPGRTRTQSAARLRSMRAEQPPSNDAQQHQCQADHDGPLVGCRDAQHVIELFPLPLAGDRFLPEKDVYCSS